MQINEISSYREIIENKIKENAATRGYKTHLAQAAGCQKSYFTLVLKGEANLTPDHAIGLCDFWGFDDLETEFFTLLVNIERATTSKLKQLLKIRIDKIKNGVLLEEVRRNFRGEELAFEHAVRFFSFWYWDAIHTALEIPNFRTIPNLSQRLKLPESLIQQVLEGLEEMGLAQKVGEEWHKCPGKDIFHENHYLLSLMHLGLRQKAVSSFQEQKSSVQFNYSGIYSVSKEDIQDIRRVLFEAVNRVHTVKKSSKREELIGICVDFFIP